MTTLHDFIQVCDAFHSSSCDPETGEFNFEKYRECVMCISEPELNEKIQYFIDYVGPYVFCSDSNTFYIPTPGTDVFCSACEDIFKAASTSSQFSIPVVSGKNSELVDFNEMLDSDTDFSTSLIEDNKKNVLDHFEHLLASRSASAHVGVYPPLPNLSFEESIDMCIRQCSELNLNDEKDRLVKLY